MLEELTTEEKLQKTFDAAMDSVNLILGAKPQSLTDEEWADVVSRNKEHLELVIAKNELSAEQIDQLKSGL